MSDSYLERTQLARVVRQATQQARLRTMSPLVGYVGVALEGWVTNGMVTAEAARAFKDALLAAGAELALAPVEKTVDAAARAAKESSYGAGRQPVAERRRQSAAGAGSEHHADPGRPASAASRGRRAPRQGG